MTQQKIKAMLHSGNVSCCLIPWQFKVTCYPFLPFYATSLKISGFVVSQRGFSCCRSCEKDETIFGLAFFLNNGGQTGQPLALPTTKRKTKRKRKRGSDAPNNITRVLTTLIFRRSFRCQQTKH